jgi:hypothetical protein
MIAERIFEMSGFFTIEFAYLYGLFAAFILAPLAVIEIVVWHWRRSGRED